MSRRPLLLATAILVICAAFGARVLLYELPRTHATARRVLEVEGRAERTELTRSRARPTHRTEVLRSSGAVLAVEGQLNVAFRREPTVGELTDLEDAHGLHLVGANRALAVYTFEASRMESPVDPAALALHPLVRYAEPNLLAKPCAYVPGDHLYPDQESLREARIDEAWRLGTGDPSVVVAVVDTGVDASHTDLAGRVLAGWNFHEGTVDTADHLGHGTAMASIIAAAGDNGWGMAGVAWGSAVLPVKVTDANGHASFANLASGIVYAADRGARIINVSMGARVGSRLLRDAVDYARARGALVVASAGNEATNVEMYPAAYPGVLCVAASGRKGPIGGFTNIGNRTDLLAPGEDVTVAVPGAFGTGSCCHDDDLPTHVTGDGAFTRIHGTSASAALVSGAAALVLAHRPSLGPAQVAAALVASARAVPGIEGAVRAGALDAEAALRLAERGGSDLAVERVEMYPARPLPGQAVVVVARVANHGIDALGACTVAVDGGGSAGVAALGPGEAVEVEVPWTAPPATGPATLTLRATPPVTDPTPADNVRLIAVPVDPVPAVDLAVTRIAMGEPRASDGAIPLEFTARNRGSALARDAELLAVVDGMVVGGERLDGMAPGESRTVRAAWTVPASLPDGVLVYAARVRAPGDVRADNDEAWMDFLVAGEGKAPVETQYQQGGDVDIIVDAPYRIEPLRPYVPLMIFVPDKGAKSHEAFLTFHGMDVVVKDDPAYTSPGNRIYEDGTGREPSTIPHGLEVVDENGQVLTRGGLPNPNLFQDDELRVRGRSNILRITRDTLGVPPVPSATVTKYLDVNLRWRFARKLLFFYTYSDGVHRSVLRVQFASDPLPALPGEARYYDTHVHTIAEWFFGSTFNLLAPRKAYGGPVHMYKETAYAMGIIDRFGNFENAVITTDHNLFFNRQVSDPNDEDVRPPFGPTSQGSSQSPDEFDANRAYFGGLTAGQEVAFNELAMGIAPLGGHMLTYRGEHIEGPWHGGSTISQWLGQGSPVELKDVLTRLARQNQQTNADAFTYAAHPFSSQGWGKDKFEMVLGIDPAHRTTDFVSATKDEFVYKGLQLYNGRNARHLDSSKVDFDELNPWADAAFAGGNPDWDKPVQEGLVRWHEQLSQTLAWSFNNTPGRRFIRKHYIEAGSDAHGDFNFGVGRLATFVPLQSTFSVDDNAYGKVRTYVFSEGSAGTSPAERGIHALSDGNSCITDGPLARFAMDAEGRFDSDTLAWHDLSGRFENEDGRMGGSGPAFDGGGTMLVERGNPYVLYRYRYTNTPEFGSAGGLVQAVQIYKTEPNLPNPTRARGSFHQIVGRGTLRAIAPDTDLVEEINPSQEGAVNAVSAFALGAFTGGDPDTTALGVDEYRCYTNPVWAIPYDARVEVAGIDTARGVIPRGNARLTLRFDLSMEPRAYTVEVKRLDRQGRSTGSSQAALGTFSSAAGWAAAGGVDDAAWVLTNDQDLGLAGEEYPSAGWFSFVVYTREPLRDTHGNALHPIARTFRVQYAGGAVLGLTGTGPGTGTAGGGGTTVAPSLPAAPTAGQTASAPKAPKGGGRKGCEAASGHVAPAEALGALLPLALLAALLAAARRRVSGRRCGVSG
ncbi:MAG: S8 family serine peptidase [Planctomycetes bacterium]|nr:S8 family serine peptidase [Planctomycetota bacterium]